MNEMVKKNKQMATVSDPYIISRVRQYLEENVHQTYVNVAIMAKCLQERYEEYGKRKTVPFRAAVEQAYKTVLRSYGLDSNNPSSEENNASDLELMEDSPNNPDHMNNMLTNLYSKQANKTNKDPVNDNELIDIISSDESGDENSSTKNQQKKQQQSQSQVQTLTLRNVSVSKVGDKEKQNIPQPNDKRNCVSSALQSGGPLPKKRKTNNQNEEQLKGQRNKYVGQPITGEGPTLMNPNRTKRYKKPVIIQYSQQTFRDIGGVNKVLKDLCELLFHIKHPEIYHTIGLSPPRGILLHGPPGCGKTLLANVIAGQLKIGLIEVPATELIAGISGESEERIRDVFEQAIAVAPCVLFIDNIDAISSNRLNAQKDMERRIVSQLISCLDNLSKDDSAEQVVVIGATTRPECLDPALRRVGRFDHEIALGVPDRKEREEILFIICEVLSLAVPFDYAKIAELTPGYVGADLLALTTRAAAIAVRRKYLNKIRSIQWDVNIPIVDLLDETQTNAIENIEKKSTIENKENESENVEKNGSDKPNDNRNGEVKDLADEDIGNADSTKETPENKNGMKNVNTSDRMDVDEEHQNVEETEVEKDKEVNEINEAVNVEKDTNDNETIDVDELPDVSSSNKDKREQAPADKVKIERDPSLIEMIKYLNSNSIQIQDYELEDICVTMDDFIEALKFVQPSAKREGFITVPDVTWNDIGSLRDIREELQLAILAPVKYPEKMKALGLNAPSGVLLCGPPGCGKTLLAKAIANEAGINFISVKGPELMNMYVGESERAVRTCFQRARNSAPCVIFFDEFDSLCPKRSNSLDGGSGTRVVNQLLTEMDGIEERKGVFLMAATNRPDIIDSAVLRPGRLDTILFVGLPEENDRVEILNALTKNRQRPVLDEDVDLLQIACQTDGFTGADLAGLVRQASLLALKDSLLNTDIKAEDLKLTNKNFSDAVKLTKPSVNVEDRKLYEKLRIKYAAPRSGMIM